MIFRAYSESIMSKIEVGVFSKMSITRMYPIFIPTLKFIFVLNLVRLRIIQCSKFKLHVILIIGEEMLVGTVRKIDVFSCSVPVAHNKWKIGRFQDQAVWIKMNETVIYSQTNFSIACYRKWV